MSDRVAVFNDGRDPAARRAARDLRAPGQPFVAEFIGEFRVPAGASWSEGAYYLRRPAAELSATRAPPQAPGC